MEQNCRGTGILSDSSPSDSAASDLLPGRSGGEPELEL